ncbi:MAG: hypothetical protein J6A94_01275 [Lachnospiraceae bacterium]|nr:hypothetical protein [Lachnospiraceae bacterium]
MGRSKRNIGLVLFTVLVFAVSVWGPEKMSKYNDKKSLNHIEAEPIEEENEGYRYTMNNNEKLYILAKCLNSQKLPESELSTMTKVEAMENSYDELTGSYAFVVNRQGPSEKEINKQQIYDVCNQQLEALKELGVIPESVKKVKANAYNAVLYSAIDILEPRNNLSVWKVSLFTSQQNADKSNRLLDAYIDADTGKIYEFYVRTDLTWEEIDVDDIMDKWSSYVGLENMEVYEDTNPLMENTPYFKKYRFPGTAEQNTVVTVGFYEGINELFLKISK